MPLLSTPTGGSSAGTPADTPAHSAEAVQALALQIRIHDPFGTYARWSDDLLLKPFVVTREQRRTISTEGAVEPITRGRIQAFFRSIAYRIEAGTGLMAQVVLDLNDEGFGYALVFAGKLILVNRSLRDAHRFGFASLDDLVAESDRFTAAGVATAERFAEVGRA